MKKFSCGDVVPGCDARFDADTDDAMLTAVARHARAAHGLTHLPTALVAAVLAAVVTV